MNNLAFKFLGKLLIEADLKCITALHIGGTQEGYEIGGMDNPVIKTATRVEVNGFTIPVDCPYIPGSSLKGKMRSLLEWALGRVKIDKEAGNYRGKPCECGEGDCPVCVTFGVSAKTEVKAGPTRLTVLDAFPTEETIRSWERDMGEGIFTEIKTENYIDRLSSQANPRSMERVPAGSVFKTRMIYTLYRDTDIDMIKNVFLAMEILEDSTLGGSGSRGSGRVEFGNFDIRFRSKLYYTENVPELSVNLNVDGKKLNSPREIKETFDKVFGEVKKTIKDIHQSENV